VVIQKFVIWNTLLVVETRSNTEDSQKILEEMLAWGAERFGFHYRPAMIKRYGYVSDLAFYSDSPLLNVSSPIAHLAKKTSKVLSEIWGKAVDYEVLNINVGHDPEARKYGIAPFSIARRAEAQFSENKYFSEAPLPTDVHIKFLEEYERDILGLAASIGTPIKTSR
jgi:hypothetical protein